MHIELINIGRRFNKEWIFKNISYSFNPGSYAVLGANGSGKSTFLQLISGVLSPSEGQINYFYKQESCKVDNVFEHISFAAPYIDIIDEFTLSEMLEFHFSFKKIQDQMSVNDIIDILGMQNQSSKVISNFSSGMKQRVKLALAIFADTPVLLLDEPTINLDNSGLNWFLEQIKKYSTNKILLIASNQIEEYSFCENKIDVSMFNRC